MQVENLRFHRKYSFRVGVLIVLQVALAALAVDWGKANEKLVYGFQWFEGEYTKINVTKLFIEEESFEPSKAPGGE